MPISLYFSSRFPLFSIEEKEKEEVEEEEVEKKKEEARKKRRGSFQKELSLVVEIRSAMYSEWKLCLGLVRAFVRVVLLVRLSAYVGLFL